MAKRINIVMVAKRLAASMLDIVCWVVFCVPALFLIFADSWSNNEVQSHWALLLALLLLYPLPEAIWGWTIGKWFMRLRVVALGEAMVTGRMRLVRFMCKYSPLFLFISLVLLDPIMKHAPRAEEICQTSVAIYVKVYMALSLMGILLPKVRRSIHDVISGTMVVCQDGAASRG